MLGTHYPLKGFSVSTGLAWATGRHRFPVLCQDGGWQPAAYVLVLRSGPSFARWAGLFSTPLPAYSFRGWGKVTGPLAAPRGPGPCT